MFLEAASSTANHMNAQCGSLITLLWGLSCDFTRGLSCDFTQAKHPVKEFMTHATRQCEKPVC